MSFSGYEQVFILKDQLVSGVTSIDAGYDTQTEPLYIAGMGYVDNFISGPTEGSVQISRYMLGPDFIKDIGDEEPLSGGVIYDNGQCVGFQRGRLLEYTVSCNVGQVPTIKNSFKVYGNLGGGISPVQRWSATKEYSIDGLASMSKTATNGFAIDEIYKSKTDNNLNNLTDDTSNWEFLGAGPTGVLKAREVLDAKYPLENRTYTVPTQGSMTVSFDGSTENAVLGFNYSRGLDLESLYALREAAKKGTPLTDYEALDIQIRYPIKSTFDFTVSLDNYKLSDMRAFMDYSHWSNGRIEQDISISIKDPQNLSGPDIMTYSVTKAKLLSEQTGSNAGEETTLNISFEGYERDAGTPDPYFNGGTNYAGGDFQGGAGDGQSQGLEQDVSNVNTRQS